jgi:hypothetical protein
MTSVALRPSNRLNLDYLAEARRMGPPVVPIIDVHSHIMGLRAAALYRKAAEAYGVALTYSMTALEQAEAIWQSFEGRLRLIAIPDFGNKDRRYAHGKGYIERLERFHALGSRIAKFWSAPRIVDYAHELGDPALLHLNSPLRLEVMQAAMDMGFMFMVHIGDPDTWFATKYRDAAKYGTKRDHYRALEDVLDRFGCPWIAAHMAGWPESLETLSELLDRHANLYLDISATKWMVRELSRHPRREVIEFLRRWKGRVLFGSDIVTSDEHLQSGENKTEMAAKASNPDDAFDLYASRYWAYRTMFETGYEGESPIADPDLAMVEPQRYGPLDAPPLRGLDLPEDLLRSIYRDAAHALLEPRHAEKRP